MVGHGYGYRIWNGKAWDECSDAEREAWIDDTRAAGGCGAKPRPNTPRSYPCTTSGTGAGSRCRLHGGLSPGRPATGGGIYSDRMNKHRAAYQAVMEDPDLLRIEPSIGLIKLQELRMLDRIEQNDSPKFRERVRDLFEELDEAVKGGDPGEVMAALTRLGNYIKRANAEDAAWRELIKTAIEKNQQIVSAAQVALKGAEAISMRDLTALMMQTFEIVIDEAGSPVLAQRIINRLHREVLGGGRGPTEVSPIDEPE